VVRSALVAAVVGATSIAAAEVGCSSNGASREPGGSSPAGPGAPATDDTGSVGMRLTLEGGQTVNSVNWTVTGPNGASTVVQTGTVALGNSQTISFLIGGIPPGNGYTITLSGTSTDGTVVCSGSVQFNTTPRTTTNISVTLQCNAAPSDAGSALVNGSTYSCASVNTVTAIPSETTVGQSVAVTGAANGPTPSALTYAWSATRGTFDTPGAASANFTCTAVGPVTLTLTVGDGPVDDGGACDAGLSTQSFQVQCDAVITDGGTSG